MQEKQLKSTQWSITDIIAICIVVGLFLATVAWASVLHAKGADMPQQHPLALSALILMALLVVAVITFIWWRNIDEAAREAHKWSWYWGGSVGLCVVMVLFLLANMTNGHFGQETIAAWGLSGRELELGMATGVLLPVIGYALAWGIWWIRRR